MSRAFLEQVGQAGAVAGRAQAALQAGERLLAVRVRGARPAVGLGGLVEAAQVLEQHASVAHQQLARLLALGGQAVGALPEAHGQLLVSGGPIQQLVEPRVDVGGSPGALRQLEQRVDGASQVTEPLFQQTRERVEAVRALRLGQ